jgi:hypothetical protein
LKNGNAEVRTCTDGRYYKQGYEEGYADGLETGPEEGYEFGHQVSFQRFLPLGIILGRCTVWKQHVLASKSIPPSLTEAKKTRVIKQIGLLENMIASVDKENESEENHGKFDEMKIRIMSKCRVVESLMGEEQSKKSQKGLTEADEDPISLAKRMDQELQL